VIAWAFEILQAKHNQKLDRAADDSPFLFSSIAAINPLINTIGV
jgi:hypothetical protein